MSFNNISLMVGILSQHESLWSTPQCCKHREKWSENYEKGTFLCYHFLCYHFFRYLFMLSFFPLSFLFYHLCYHFLLSFLIPENV